MNEEEKSEVLLCCGKCCNRYWEFIENWIKRDYHCPKCGAQAWQIEEIVEEREDEK